jgi:hypothetical protein
VCLSLSLHGWSIQEKIRRGPDLDNEKRKNTSNKKVFLPRDGNDVQHHKISFIALWGRFHHSTLFSLFTRKKNTEKSTLVVHKEERRNTPSGSRLV